VLYGPVLYSIVGQAILGGRCHGLIIFRSADAYLGSGESS
jgi:hypothetical protein